MSFTVKEYQELQAKFKIKATNRHNIIVSSYSTQDANLKEKLRNACNKKPEYVISVAQERIGLKRKYQEEMKSLKDIEDKLMVKEINNIITAAINKKPKLEEPALKLSPKAH